LEIKALLAAVVVTIGTTQRIGVIAIHIAEGADQIAAGIIDEFAAAVKCRRWLDSWIAFV